MDKQKFRELARRLGLKTGAELEKIIAFQQAEPECLDADGKRPLINEESPAFACENSASQGEKKTGETAFEGDGKMGVDVSDNQGDNQQRSRQKYLAQSSYFTLPKGYENKYARRINSRPDLSVEKGLAVSLKLFKRVDVEYISALCARSLKDVITSLEGKIFKNPDYDGDKFYEGYVYASEYLSGNVVQKLKKAIEKNKTNPHLFDINISALSGVVPPKPKFGEFYLGLGSPWIPAEYVADFVQYLFRMTLMRDRRICEVVYERAINRWFVVLNYDVRKSIIASKTYGTERMDMFKILEKTLNHEQIKITDSATENKKGRSINREQTMLVEEKRTLLKDSFIRWLSEIDESKKNELCDSWHEKFCYFSTKQKYTLPKSFSDLNEKIELYSYQKYAIARILQSKTTLLAHDVGAGKTYAMIVSAHELSVKRGCKNLIVVPNSILTQWESDYKLLYPNAKILCVHPSDFTPLKRESCLDEIASDNYESVIMAYSTFELIEHGNNWEIAFCNKKIIEIEQRIRENAKRRTLIKNKVDALLVKNRARYYDRQAELKKQLDQKQGRDFDDLGFNSLFLDEAHNYKNLPLESSLGTVKGINVEGSAKCFDVYLKTRRILADGGKVIFATGTPITNSVADAFVMQKYLQEDRLSALDLSFFDNWAGVFGEITRSYEIDVDTENYRLTTRFNRFNNLKLLSQMLNRFTDFHTVGQDGLPTLESVQTIVVKKSEKQAEMLKEISDRVEKIRAGLIDRKQDNLLKVTTDGRKLALDPRLILTEENGQEGCGNKARTCADKISEIYFSNVGKTQLVFCDIGTPKATFNVYDELKRLLVMRNVPAEKIGFIHDACGDKKRAQLFESVNNGAIAILIGSTFKLGTGVNVQEKLIALHHLDVPWRPSDMVQREGRLIRRGNTNEKVFIYRYVTEGSFDAYSWQLLENKQRFITELLMGTAEGTNEAQLDDAVLGYAEVKALAIGNPLLKTRIELVNEISRYKMLMREELKKNESIMELVRSLPYEIEQKTKRLNDLKADIKQLEKNSEIADKAAIAQLISFATSQNEGDINENIITEVNGFLVILPASFSRVRPYLILQGEARYTVDLTTFGMGAVIKIENFFKNLKQQEPVLQEQLLSCEMQYKEACLALKNKTDYSETVSELAKRLAEVDKQLGI